MDKYLLRLYVSEIKLQCEFAMYAYEKMLEAIKRGDVFNSFFHAHAFLDHVANVSKIIWPKSPDGSLRDPDRTRAILNALGIKELQPAEFKIIEKRTLRNHLEHFDDRLRDWYEESKRHNFVDMNIIPKSAIRGIEPVDFFRNIDPNTLIFYFQGKEYNLNEICQKIVKLRELAKKWQTS